MAAVWLRFRTELHSKWRSFVVVAVLVGVAGGVTLAALAGARRTDRAYPEFIESQHAYDVLVVSGRPPIFPSASFDLDEIARLPMVVETARFAVLGFFGVGPEGQTMDFDTNVPLVTTDGRFGTEMNRLHMLEGRAPRRPNEVAPSFVVAEELGLQVGDHIDGSFATSEQIEVLFDTGQPPFGSEPSELRLRVVGIEASPAEFPPLSEAGSNSGFLHFAPSFAESPFYAPAVHAVTVRLKQGAEDVPAFKAALERRAGGRTIFLRTGVETATATQRAIGVQSDALRLVALLGAVVGALLIGQALLRQARLDAGDQPVLRALGMSPSQQGVLATARVALIGIIGATVACVLALALSPLTPVGLARNAETAPGIHADALVLGVGFVALVAAVLACGIPALLSTVALASRPQTSRASGRIARRSRLTDVLARAGMPPTVVNGVRLAVDTSRGAAAVPVRSTIAGVTMAVVVLAGVAGFTASLEELLDEPRLYGWNWDAQLGDPFSPNVGEEVAEDLAKDPEVGAVAYGSLLQVTIASTRVDVLGISAVKGGLAPALADGRAPRFDNEIALGSKSLAAVGASLGDNVRVEFGSRARRMHIVGEVVLPDLGEAGGLGHGGAMTVGGVRMLAPQAAGNIVLVRAESPHRADELVADLGDVTEGSVVELGGPYTPSRPIDLENIRRADSMPFVIGLGSALVAIGTIVHGLAASVRRRRRDLAILKTLGFGRRRISQVVLWQATTVGLIGLVIGIPLGIVAGRVAWSLVADQLGVLSEPAVSVLALAVLVPAVLVVANVAAAFPGRMAARTRPAMILRSE